MTENNTVFFFISISINEFDWKAWEGGGSIIEPPLAGQSPLLLLVFMEFHLSFPILALPKYILGVVT